MAEAYCDLCDLPLAQCVHGMPPAPPKAAPEPKPKRTRTTPAVSTAKKSAPNLSVRRTGRLRTAQQDFREPILAALREAGGRAEGDQVLAAVEQAMVDVLRDGDHEKSATGEPRWRLNARYERKAMTDDGLLHPPREPGIWELAED